ncbi:MAG: SGNH/GDSL hydrolase family protein [Gammaproteobacteria bacterium]|nr:SGNH/GDSL hydrolase family protein [Gammaproteobacteria bacterium]
MFNNKIRAIIASLFLLLPTFTSAHPYSELVVFGDSLSDNGNLFAVTGGAVPPSPFYWEGRSSNGPVWAENMATSLGVTLRDYAIAGATTGTSNVWDDDFGASFGGLQTQVNDYATGGAINTSALHVIWAGSNNFLTIPTDPYAAAMQAVTEIVTSVMFLDSLGVTNIAVANLPDLGRTPRLAGTLYAGAATELSMGVNTALGAALDSLPIELFQVDIFALFDQVFTDPASFGINNTSDACLDIYTYAMCANPDEYAFWDDIHPTAAVHRILAAEFKRVTVPEPGTLITLVAGLLLLLVVTAKRGRQSPAFSLQS